MIDYIILEDDLYYLNKYKNIIDKIMINYDINYNIYMYDKYSSKLIKDFNKETFKIYIIDYNKKTTEMLKYIREKLDDWQSLIILMFKNIEDKKDIINKNYFIVDYIDKFNNYSNKLKRSINICLRNYDQRPNSLKYSYKRVVYNIEYRNILYIEKEQDNKRCIIKTPERNYYIPGTLNRMEELLDNRFIKCSRSYIINIEQIESYDMKNNTIYFKNGVLVSAVSRDKKKDIINMLRKV